MSFSETEPSIAAVVGSMDAKCSTFSAEVQLQGHRVEIIQVSYSSMANSSNPTSKKMEMEIKIDLQWGD